MRSSRSPNRRRWAGVGVALSCLGSTALLIASADATSIGLTVLVYSWLSSSFFAAGLLVRHWLWPAVALLVPALVGGAVGGYFTGPLGAP